MKKQHERLLAYGFGVVFMGLVLSLAVLLPEPTAFQYTVFRIVLALSAAGVATMIPGFLQVEVGPRLRAGGALGVFVVVYFFSPAQLVLNEPIDILRTGPLALPIRDRTALRRPTDTNEIPGVAVHQILEGKSFDRSSRVYEVVMTNNSHESVFLGKLKTAYEYRTNHEPFDEAIYAEKLVPQSSIVLEIPIDTTIESVREVSEVIHPAVEIPPRDSTGPGRQTIRIQFHYSFENNVDHHPYFGWNIYYTLAVLDEHGRQVTVFTGAKWREPDPFW